MEGFNYVESQILLWIQEHLRMPFLNGMMTTASMLNNAGMLAIMTVVVLLLIKKYRNVGITAFCSLGVEYIIVNLLIKNIVARPRPFVVNEALTLLGTRPGDYSFPSGHTGSVFAVSMVMLLCMPKKYGVTATVIATVIAFSRLYNGAHYPTDVLGAFVIACAIGFLASKLVFPRISVWLGTRRKGKI